MKEEESLTCAYCQPQSGQNFSVPAVSSCPHSEQKFMRNG
jgi:hypothetical protein